MIKYNKEAEKLADFIEANPHCKFDIDNDSWYIMKHIEGNKTDLQKYFDQEYEENQIADDSDYQWQTFKHLCRYGIGVPSC